MNRLEEPPRLRSIIMEILSEAEDEPGSFLAKLQAIKEKYKVQVFSHVLSILTHLNFNESEAEEFLKKILQHRREMQNKLKRDLGLRVSALDYFLNIEKKLDNPKVIELSLFEQTEKSAVTDWLTGLHNLRFFRICLQKEFHRARRYRAPLSLLFLDIDNFKDVNDAHGHLFGDIVLKEVSRIIRKNVRDSDMPFRYGGEEFSVILPETARMGAYRVAERVRNGIEMHFKKKTIEGSRIPITMSGGISVFPDDALNDVELLQRADQALYNAKAGGKNRISIFYMERRNFIRFDIAGGDPQVKIVQRKNGKLGNTLCAKNISKGGILFEASVPFPLGEEIKIVIQSLHGRKKMEIFGRVMRLEEILYSDGRKGYDIGVAFMTDSEEEQRELIDFFVKHAFDFDVSPTQSME